MKLFLFVLIFTAFCYVVPTNANDEAPVEGDEITSDAELEAEFGEQGISEAIVQLPTLPQDIDNTVPWECTPRMWYKNSCQACKCTRQRQLRCIRRRCDK
ncbi:hypothetical protein PVAND_004854 [Polypedilum vanderplanki]|uniref:Uncharacterized protein n=1 Tax=Polypedilum vanderplanki TaxID=319348 RepID=A0A9J6BZC0_POLVA|nr:hypothetical protein PVAND_004854 [Polypedilum vanderplanki]